MKKLIPLWINILAGLIALSTLAFTLTLYISPQTFFPKTDFSINDVRHFTAMWSLRQFSVGALLAYALIRQDGSILKTVLILLTLINFLTIPIAILRNDLTVIFESVVYCALGVSMIIAINKRAAKTYRLLFPGKK